MSQERLNESVPYLLTFSDEVLVMIFSFLDTKDKLSLSKVCRRFDNLLLDRRLCRDIVILPENEASCLDHIGIYLRKRRQLIRSLNINSCHWIPMPKVTLITKNLPNLVSLNVMSIALSVKSLSNILKESNQLRELSWSWQGDGKSSGIPWSEVPADKRMGLAGLERLHICLPDPWCLATRELYGFCHNLTHLTVEVNPSFPRLPLPKSSIGENLIGPTKLKSLIVWQNTLVCEVEVDRRLKVSVEIMLRHFWRNCGGFHRAWECLWTNAYMAIPWKNEEFPPQFNIITTNLKSIVIDSVSFSYIRNELPLSELAINMYMNDGESTFPPLNAVAPKLQKLAIITDTDSMELNSWISAGIGSSDYLVEINLFGVHYCGDNFNLEKLWLALKSLRTLKKLAVAPCFFPKIEKGPTSRRVDVRNHPEMVEVDKKSSPLLRLSSLEEFEMGNLSNNIATGNNAVCNQLKWVHNFESIRMWSKLTCLTFDSIPFVKSLDQFKMVTTGCKNLTSVRFRDLGLRGYCSYVGVIAASISCCQTLKHFRLEQSHIFDQMKVLLVALSSCTNLESIAITNNSAPLPSYLKRKEDFKQALLQLTNSCPHLSLLLVALPDITMPSCNRIKNEILKRTSHSKKSALVMEFCSYPKILGATTNKYHEFLKFPFNSRHHDIMHMPSKVALSPPLGCVS